jgi:putative methionine-R-sulfoxide reductase with GAF domain
VLYASAILAFGVLLMVCVLLLLRREPGEIAGLELMMRHGVTSGRYLQHLNRVLRAIRAINSIIVTERNEDEVLRKACSTLTETRGFKMAWIGLVEEDSKRVVPVSEAGFEKGYLREISVTWDDSPTGQGPTGQAIKTAEPSIMRDIQTAPEYRPWREQALERGYRSSAALPLRFRGEVIGALNVYSEMPNAFDIEEVGILQEVADHLAYAIGALRLESELVDARRELRRTARLKTATDYSPYGVMTADSNGTITSINSVMLGMLDDYESPEDVIDTVKVSELSVFASLTALEDLRDCLAKRTAGEFEWREPADGGSTLRCRIVPVPGEEGLAESIVVVERLTHGASQGGKAGVPTAG